MYYRKLRELRLFTRALCRRYKINFLLTVKECTSSIDTEEEIQLKIRNGNTQLFYCNIPVCPVTNEMIDKTIKELEESFQFSKS